MTKKSYIVAILIRDIPTVLVEREIFSRLRFRSAGHESVFRRSFRDAGAHAASLSFCRVRRKRERERETQAHPLGHLRPTSQVEGSDIGLECFYSITPARRHPLNHLLNPRPSALSPSRSRLMAFENSNIIRRSIPSPLCRGKGCSLSLSHFRERGVKRGVGHRGRGFNATDPVPFSTKYPCKRLKLNSHRH